MPHLRLVLSLGWPNPDRLSTSVLWSIFGHLLLTAGIVVYQMLPSSSRLDTDAFFVHLATAEGPKGGGPAGPKAEPAARAAPAAAKPAPEPPPAPPSPPKAASLTPPPSKEPVHPPKPAPPRKSAEPREAQRSEEDEADESGDEDSHAPPAHGAHGSPEGKAGTGGGAGGGAGPGAGGVGGTSFGEGDFQYGWYQAAIESKLQSQWRRPIATAGAVQTAVVSFTIMRTGAVRAVEISTPSGNSALDLSVMRAVYDANPLPQLPRGWSGDSVHVTMEFRLTNAAP